MKTLGLVTEIKRRWILFLMILPTTILVLIFAYVPMFGLLLAFKRYSVRLGILGSPWVGFDNFMMLVKSGALFRIVRNTVLYNIFFLTVNQSIQIIMAIFISETIGKIYKKFAQGIMFLPYFISFVILGSFVYGILNYEVGVLNGFLTSIGLKPFDAYSNPAVWPFIIFAAQAWKWLGYGTVIFLAAATTIDPILYEAAEVDGASKWQQIWHITIPGMLPAIIICSLLAIGRILKGQFELFYNLVGNNGRLYETTDVIDTFVFRSLIVDFDVGKGTAVGLFQSVFGFLLVIAANYAVRRYNEEYSLF